MEPHSTYRWYKKNSQKPKLSNCQNFPLVGICPMPMSSTPVFDDKLIDDGQSGSGLYGTTLSNVGLVRVALSHVHGLSWCCVSFSFICKVHLGVYSTRINSLSDGDLYPILIGIICIHMVLMRTIFLYYNKLVLDDKLVLGKI